MRTKKCFYYINEVLSEAPPQVLYEGRLTVVVFQQDEVLHPNPVPGGQGTLHHQAHSSFNVHLLHRKTGEALKEQTYRNAFLQAAQSVNESKWRNVHFS